jgi:hypothetical protein
MAESRAEVRPWWKGISWLVVTMIISVLGIVIAAFQTWSSPPKSDSTQINDSIQSVRIRLVEAKTTSALQQIKVLKKEISALKRPTDRRKVAAEVRGMREKVNQLDGEMSGLQTAILRSPAKAIELPLLARDLDNQRAANQASLAAIQQDIDRQYDLMKWIVGSFIVGIGGMVFAAIKSAREAPKSSPPAEHGG